MSLTINSIHNLRPGECVSLIMKNVIIEAVFRYECNGFATIETNDCQFISLRNNPHRSEIQVLIEKIPGLVWEDTLVDILS